MTVKGTAKMLLPLTPRQRTDLDALAGELSAASYLRKLVAGDAARRGLTWHDDIPAVGKIGQGRRKRS